MNPGAHAHALARRWTVAAGVVLVAGAWIAAGGGAAASSAAAAMIVVLFLSSGFVALRLLGRQDVPCSMGFVVILLAFALRLLAVLFAAALITRFDWVDTRWLGASIVGCALVWIIAHTLHAWRRATSEPIIEPENTDERGGK